MASQAGKPALEKIRQYGHTTRTPSRRRTIISVGPRFKKANTMSHTPNKRQLRRISDSGSWEETVSRPVAVATAVRKPHSVARPRTGCNSPPATRRPHAYDATPRRRGGYH